MKLGEKLKYLRETEGELRGLGRAITQQEMVRALRAETGAALSQSYLSQIESGARPHLTNTSRQVLARFFKVHPGYLVDDPEGYHAELLSDARTLEDKLDLWLVSGAERFRRDPGLRRALLALSRHDDSRRCLQLLQAVIETPGLVDRLFEVLGGRAEETSPRGLRSSSSSAAYGTAEVVPFQSESSRGGNPRGAATGKKARK
ncbi:MAG: helix-turn-helix transcriptional regulator [Acidobacteriaceae bacterium]